MIKQYKYFHFEKIKIIQFSELPITLNKAGKNENAITWKKKKKRERNSLIHNFSKFPNIDILTSAFKRH